jgi:hypothetical protein
VTCVHAYRHFKTVLFDIAGREFVAVLLAALTIDQQSDYGVGFDNESRFYLERVKQTLSHKS